MSRCKNCLADIVWAQRENGRWLPPLDTNMQPVELPQTSMLGGSVLLAWSPVRNLWVEAIPSDKLALVNFHQCQPDEPAGPPPVDLSMYDREPITSPSLSESVATSPVVADEAGLGHRNAAMQRFWTRSKTKMQTLSVACPRCAAAEGALCCSVDNKDFFLENPHDVRKAASSDLARLERYRQQADIIPENWQSDYLQEMIKRYCSACEAPPGIPCMNLHALRLDKPLRVYLKTAHPARKSGPSGDSAIDDVIDDRH